jgi:hypothetical protein
MSKLSFDENNILSIEIPISYGKEYSFSLMWMKIVSQDKGLLVYNKRKWRIIHLKELSEWMQACYIQKNRILWYQFDKKQVRNTLSYFDWFNEETWEKTHFIPYFSWNNLKLQDELKENFSFDWEIIKDKQWTFVRGIEGSFLAPESIEEILSFLFVLCLIYWKIDEKWWEVSSIRAHIPCFWKYHIHELLEQYFQKLLKEIWCFVVGNLVNNWNRSVFQFSITDADLLELFVKWYNECFKVDYSLTIFQKKQEEIKQQLEEYLKWEEFSGIEWVEDVLSQFSHRLKFIKYN